MYKTFKRSYGRSGNFLAARKITVDTGLTYKEARERCEEFNKNRNARQIRNGTMMEFTET